MSDSEQPPAPAQSRVEVIHRVNRLKIKAGGDASGAPLRFDQKLMSNAVSVVQSKIPDYLVESTRHLSELESLCTALIQEKVPAERRRILERIAAVAHEAQGLGGTFNYPLATRFAASLRDFCESIEDADGHKPAIVKAHVDAFKAVIRGKIAGDGGAVGIALIDALNKAIGRPGG